ncbi:MAG TPA: CHAT domain-containing protein [Leptolyngbyaceae cyanobacterium]
MNVLQEDLAARQKAGERIGIAQTLNKIGEIYVLFGNYNQALDVHQQALAIYQELRNPQGEANTLGYLGNVYFNAGQYKQVEDLFRQKLNNLRKIGDRAGEKLIVEVMSRYLANEWGFKAGQGIFISLALHKRLGEGKLSWQEQLEITELNLFINRETEDLNREIDTLHGMGWIYRNLGHYSRALDFYQQAIEIAKKQGKPFSQAFLLVELGILYTDLAQYDRALSFLQESLTLKASLSENEKDFIGHFIFNKLGLVYSKLGQYERALVFFEQALAKPGFDLPNILNNIGSTYFKMGDYPKALESYQKALGGRLVGEPGMNGFILNQIGLVKTKIGNYPEALEDYQKALSLFQQIGDRPGEGLTLSNMGETLLKQGSFTEATEKLLAAIKILESLRSELSDANKVSIFETQFRTYSVLQQALIKQNKIESALEIAERGRARAFVELLAKRLSSNLNEEIKINPLTIEQIKQIAKERKATLVEYSIITDDVQVTGQPKERESELYIWVVKPTGEVLFRQVDIKSLWQQQKISFTDLIFSSRDSIGVRGRGIAVAARVESGRSIAKFQQLHQLLIEPIADLLPTDPNARIVFMPQGELFLVPFAALQDASGKYLIEKHTILTAPAIQVLDLTSQQRKRLSRESLSLGGKEALIVGNPTMPSVATEVGQSAERLPSLPGAEREAKAIAQLLGTKALTGNQATKASILGQISQARLIHLATHGLLDDFLGQGIPGAIALAPSGDDNGLLTASEILDLKLNAELVVLSACDTGRGKITGDGVIGLSRSLILAGVPSAIVSLWAVPDAPTASLMTEFYQNLQKQPDKAFALRQAMLTTMQQHPNPRDWAAFTLIGEAE